MRCRTTYLLNEIRLGCVRRVDSQERGVQRIHNVEGEVKEKLKISRLLKQQEVRKKTVYHRVTTPALKFCAYAAVHAL